MLSVILPSLTARSQVRAWSQAAAQFLEDHKDVADKLVAQMKGEAVPEADGAVPAPPAPSEK